nr:tRNA-guanine transglycosylase [bacterium]
ILDAVERGIDMFDCVLPTRMGRNAAAFTSRGRINLRNAAHARDDSPIDPECDGACCRNFSRAYVRHLFMSGEIMAARITSFHNLAFYARMMALARKAILENRFASFKRDFEAKLNDGGVNE